jgi:hypothetical protein
VFQDHPVPIFSGASAPGGCPVDPLCFTNMGGFPYTTCTEFFPSSEKRFVYFSHATVAMSAAHFGSSLTV